MHVWGDSGSLVTHLPIYFNRTVVGLTPSDNVFGPFWVFGTSQYISYQTTNFILFYFESGNSLQILLFPDSKMIKNGLVVLDEIHCAFFASGKNLVDFLYIFSIFPYLARDLIHAA